MKRAVIAIAIVLMLGLAVVAHEPLPPSTVIVAHRNFLNQTAALPPTALFTPGTDNDFRLSVYVAVSDCAGNNGEGTVSFADTWNDGVASNFYSGVVAPCTTKGATAYAEASQVIHAAADQTISFYTGYSGASSPYNLYVTLEKL
jgi:hypothetical protein